MLASNIVELVQLTKTATEWRTAGIANGFTVGMINATFANGVSMILRWDNSENEWVISEPTQDLVTKLILSQSEKAI